jgi:8-oxo-dGTP pyrophosphatase MutT (NUDIX family)
MEKVIMAAGGVVENEKGELLLIFRKKHWDLPKGKLDGNESLEECALREVEEETGLENLQLGKLIDTTLHQYEEDGDLVTKKTAWYHMRGASTDRLVPQTEEDIEDLRWVRPEALEPYTQQSYPNIVHILNKVTGMA